MTRPARLRLGVPMDEYLGSRAANASLLSTLLNECPRAAWFASAMNPDRPADDPTKAMDAGTICHGILLEGDASRVEVIDPLDYIGPKGGIPKGWTTDAIREARDTARALGRIPVLKDDFAAIEAMVASAEEFIRTSEIADIWPDTDREVTLQWEEPGIALRCRPDAVKKDRSVVIDVKSTGGTAEPSAWARTQVPGHNELQAALGVRGLRKVVEGLRAVPRFVWLVIEQQPPYLCSLVAPDPAMMALAEAKLEHAMRVWAQCVASGVWPGYPSRICWVSPPPWELNRWEERELQEIEAHGIEYDPAKLWQKPTV